MSDTLVNCRGSMLSLAATLIMASAPTVTAQVSGTVREPGGIPVAEATVALWKGSREVARTITDGQGGFRLTGDSSGEGAVLLVRRIGFRPTSMPLGVKRTGLSVSLEPVATALPEVVTTAARRACPNRDEPEARRLWHAMSEHYATHLHTDDIQASSVGRGGEVAALEVGVEAGFAKHHSLGLWRTDDGSLTITFCGRDHSKPYLEGTLLVSRDTALVTARWKYRTPSPHEDAGAEVTFLSPPRRASIWLLVPLRSVFWRRLGGSDKLYVQEASAYREWKVGPYALR